MANAFTLDDLSSKRVLVRNGIHVYTEPKPVIVCVNGMIYPKVIVVDLENGYILQSVVCGICERIISNTPIRLWRESLWNIINTWPTNEDRRYSNSPHYAL